MPSVRRTLSSPSLSCACVARGASDGLARAKENGLAKATHAARTTTPTKKNGANDASTPRDALFALFATFANARSIARDDTDMLVSDPSSSSTSKASRASCAIAAPTAQSTLTPRTSSPKRRAFLRSSTRKTSASAATTYDVAKHACLIERSIAFISSVTPIDGLPSESRCCSKETFRREKSSSFVVEQIRAPASATRATEMTPELETDSPSEEERPSSVSKNPASRRNRTACAKFSVSRNEPRSAGRNEPPNPQSFSFSFSFPSSEGPARFSSLFSESRRQLRRDSV
mmetsp:Transcript_6841/g.27975  ORF Transcript_6841/g.27975 Transcript_6841/m.27975 type:complete len:288 (+) Transcript_6841:557-1420(+)